MSGLYTEIMLRGGAGKFGVWEKEGAGMLFQYTITTGLAAENIAENIGLAAENIAENIAISMRKGTTLRRVSL